jgi:hypothetical protein
MKGANLYPPLLVIGLALGMVWVAWLLSGHKLADSSDTAVSGELGWGSAPIGEVDLFQHLHADPRRRRADGRVQASAVLNVGGNLRVVREAMRERFADLCARVEHGLPREMCPFIEVRQCVGSGCFVDGIRRAGTPFDLFSSPGAAVREWTAAVGQPFLAETTWIFTVPCRAQVQAAEAHYSDLRVGERLYALSYAGEETFRYLTQRGQRNSAVGDRVQHTDCPDYWDRSESWTRLRAADGRTGWARVSDELQGTSIHEPPILDDGWPETLPATFDPFAAKGPLCSYLDRPFDGTEIALLFEDSLLRGQTASGKPWRLVLGPLQGDTGSTFVNLAGRANQNGRYQVERDRICLNPGGTNEWHCFDVVRCHEPSMMGREGLVLTGADDEHVGIVLEYEMGVSHRIWSD